MITALLVLAATFLCGIPLAAALDRTLRGLTLAGCSFLLGAGWVSLVLFLLSESGLGWRMPLVIFAVLGPPLALLFLMRHRIKLFSTPGAERKPAAALVDLLTVALIAGYALYSTLAPLWEWDFWAIWGLKGAVFFQHGGVDWAFLQRPDNIHFHTDYPLLLPLLYDAFALMARRWDDISIGLVFPAFAASALMIVRAEVEVEAGSALVGAVATLAAAGLACSRWIGMGEGPFIAFAIAGLLLARRGVMAQSAGRMRLAAVLLGLGAWTKNEGMVLIAGVILGAALALGKSWRTVRHFWPALVIPLFWAVEKSVHHLSLDLTSGNVPDRVREHLSQLSILLGAMARNPPPHPWVWVAALLSLPLAWRIWTRNEILGLTALAVQLVAYFGAFLTTPLPLVFHVDHAWSRLLGQVELMIFTITLFALLPLARLWRRGVALEVRDDGHGS